MTQILGQGCPRNLTIDVESRAPVELEDPVPLDARDRQPVRHRAAGLGDADAGRPRGTQHHAGQGTALYVAAAPLLRVPGNGIRRTRTDDTGGA